MFLLITVMSMLLLVILLAVMLKRKPCNFTQSWVITVNAKPYWTDSVIQVQKGERYSFEATGKWTDWFVKTTADGYKNIFYEPFTRNPEAPMFSLNGAVGHDKPYFFIGTKNVITMPASGKLSFFANDITGTYWNNKGSLQLKVTKM